MNKNNAQKKQLIETVMLLEDELVKIASNIFKKPEIGFHEHYACGLLTDFLSKEGFRVEKGICGLETAFRAVWQGTSRKPAICFICEYDALPKIGHACGHHLMGTGSIGAAVAIKRVWSNFSGRIEVIGSPAEEGGGGKAILVDKGIFDDIDAGLMFHTSTVNNQVIRGSTASQPITIHYKGKSAHAAAAPTKGINALDAVLQVFFSVNSFRQHMEDDSRIHGIIKNGGDISNIVPEYSQAKFQLRSKSTSYLKDVLLPKFMNIAKAAELATGATLTTEEGIFYKSWIHNNVLATLFKNNLLELGEESLPPDLSRGFGSSDIGNVMHCIPTIHPYIKITEKKVDYHTREFAEEANKPYAYQRMIVATKVLAMTGYDLLSNPQKVEEALEEHKKYMV